MVGISSKNIIKARRAEELQSQGHSLRKIAFKLAVEGYEHVSHCNVYRILRNINKNRNVSNDRNTEIFQNSPTFATIKYCPKCEREWSGESTSCLQ